MRGNGGGMRQKCPQKPDGPQLDGKAQARVIALAALNELAIPVIKVEIARSLRWRWLFGIASVPALLLLGQELDRHAPPLYTPRGPKPGWMQRGNEGG
jgi:hypothetical protein